MNARVLINQVRHALAAAHGVDVEVIASGRTREADSYRRDLAWLIHQLAPDITGHDFGDHIGVSFSYLCGSTLETEGRREKDPALRAKLDAIVARFRRLLTSPAPTETANGAGSGQPAAPRKPAGTGGGGSKWTPETRAQAHDRYLRQMAALGQRATCYSNARAC